MVSGGFDPLHPGHVAYFRAAAGLGVPRPLQRLVRPVGGAEAPAAAPPARARPAHRRDQDIEYTHAERDHGGGARAPPPALLRQGSRLAGPHPRVRAGRVRGGAASSSSSSTPSSTRRRTFSGATPSGRLDRRGRPARPRGTLASPMATSLESPESEPVRAARGATAVDAVVSHHHDGFRSGVGRFNELLVGAAGRAAGGDPEAALQAAFAAAAVVQALRARRRRARRAGRAGRAQAVRVGDLPARLRRRRAGGRRWSPARAASTAATTRCTSRSRT